ncbi:MAG: metal-dependent hydrolase [candidate division WS6 bacterium OLB20]|uniref:Metal-dependent hydrolase n=1 Tax=candidate division WS6 bacterium OLB20 TaxID=1617426 RepID=A0A136LYY7_9BACT|nr:MAG: metal-dependent hydrolase [candidate division WS6 bacterium OLB20]
MTAVKQAWYDDCMKITKYGHCCLLVSVDGTNILTDPGEWSQVPADLPKIDCILITHEHGDHLDIATLDRVLQHSPEAVIITNATTAAKFSGDYGWKYDAVEDSVSELGGVRIETWQRKHAEIIKDIQPVDNTSFLINDTLYLPGDNFFVPDASVRVLALPVCAPWLHMHQVIDFALKVKPERAFPVHDGMLADPGPFHRIPQMMLQKNGIEFITLAAGESLTVEPNP